MRILVVSLAMSCFLAVSTLPNKSFAATSQGISVVTSLDVGRPTVSINGKNYRYVLGSQQARNTHLNPPGKISIVKLTGYFKTVGIENVFVITEIEVSAQQG